MDNAKTNYLFEEMPIFQAIMKLAIPSVISQLILVIYNLADTFFIGLASNQSYFIENGLSNALISGVTICMPVFMIISAISNLFGIGAGSVISRSNGKKNPDRAKHAAGFATYACLISLVVYCLLSFLVLRPISQFLDGGDEVITKYAMTYIFITVTLCGIPTGMSTLMSHILRAEGKSFNASFGIALGGVLNVALDPLFMFVFFDIKDAALAAGLATGVSNIFALLYFVIIFIVLRKKVNLSFKFKTSYFKNKIPSEVMKIGLPACLMTLCENISYMILDYLIASMSTDVIINQAALAGVGAAKKLNMFAHSIARGMTQGVLPLIGYNKSSGRRIRMKKIVYMSSLITTSISLLCLIINLAAAKPLSSLFIHDELALSFSSKYLRIFSIGAPFSAFAYSVISFFQAIGKPGRSLLLALTRKGIVDIPLMLLAPLMFSNKNGVNIIAATPTADIICCILAAIFFFTGAVPLGAVIRIQKGWLSALVRLTGFWWGGRASGQSPSMPVASVLTWTSW